MGFYTKNFSVELVFDMFVSAVTPQSLLVNHNPANLLSISLLIARHTRHSLVSAKRS